MSPSPQSVQVEDTPKTARFKRSAAATIELTTAPLSSPGRALGSNATSTSPQAGDKHGLSDNEEDFFRSVRPRRDEWRDLSHLVGPATKDLKLSSAATARVQKYSRAPADERAFMIFVNSEVILSRFKDVAEEWEMSSQLKTLLRARIVACLLSPHIPEYKRTLLKHVTTILPAGSTHLLPDETHTSHKATLKTFTSDYAATARNAIKTVIVNSMTRYDAEKKKNIVDAKQGWCIGKLCDEIVAKLGTDADIQVTTEVQGRIALLRFIYASYPAQSAGAGYWDLVDKTLKEQRELDVATMARDIALGLADDIKAYTGDSSCSYTLTDVRSIRPESLQACADAAMREYYKTVKPKRAAAPK